ncbi:MAG: 3-coathanger stack domain-containing protein [Bacteroidota bacterium]
MTYFEKIEAYATGKMEATEQAFFEQELVENDVLKVEWEAYQLVNELVDFTAKETTEADIRQTAAEATADSLLHFSATRLSEAQIIEKQTSQKAIIRPLKSRSRAAWLAAASVLFLVGMVGLRSFLAMDNSVTSSSKKIATVSETATPIRTVEPVQNPVSESTSETEKTLAEVTTEQQEEITLPAIQKQKYEPAKVKTKPNNRLVAAKEGKKVSDEIIAKPLAMTIAAEQITTERVIKENETVIYKAQNTITLKSGFHAKAGASFTATHDKPTTPKSSNAVIQANETVAYEHEEGIVLKPGFHAKAGATFVAKAPSNETVNSDITINERESITVSAQKTVTLRPGFHAKAGSSFTAKVGK